MIRPARPSDPLRYQRRQAHLAGDHHLCRRCPAVGWQQYGQHSGPIDAPPRTPADEARAAALVAALRPLPRPRLLAICQHILDRRRHPWE